MRDAEPPFLMAPPNSIEAEQALLGCLMRDASALDRVADILREDDFYRVDHRLIFGAIQRLADRSQAVDAVTVFESLSSVGKANEVGGLPYLNTLAQSGLSAASVRRHAEIVAEKGRRRAAIAALASAQDRIFADGSEPLDDIIAALEQELARASTAGRGAEAINLQDALSAEVERIDERYHTGDIGHSGMSTGFADLDAILEGLNAGDLVIVAARPSMGKSTLALRIALHTAETGQVLFWSGEMGAPQLARKALSSSGGIEGSKLKTGRLDESDWPRVTQGIQRLQNARLAIDERPGISVPQLRAKARLMARHAGLALIVVDYLQLMNGAGENRTAQIGSISRGLKGLARELSIPVIALSQLSRAAEARTDKRPQLSDLRDSGELEQDADSVLMLYRDEFYNQETLEPGVCEVRVAKNRDGATGMARLMFDGARSRFEDLAPGWIPRRAVAKQARRSLLAEGE